MMTNEEYIKQQIAELDRKIEEQQTRLQSVATATVYGETTVGQFDSDLGVNMPVEAMGRVPMSSEAKKELSDKIQLEIWSLQNRRKSLQDELFLLDSKKPENVAKRAEENRVKTLEEQKAQLQDERLKHEEGYKHLDTLIEYLKLAGLKDLATRLTKMRFAFKKPKATYVTEEVDLISKEKALKSKTQTTKKEYKEIKKNVVRLTKEATHLAKEYKELYNLYLRAQEIVRDINRKGISQVTDINELGVILNEYFTQPTSLYYEGTSLGYQCLDFYRNSSSKYNEDVRSHRI